HLSLHDALPISLARGGTWKVPFVSRFFDSSIYRASDRPCRPQLQRSCDTAGSAGHLGVAASVPCIWLFQPSRPSRAVALWGYVREGLGIVRLPHHCDGGEDALPVRRGPA